MNPQGMPQNMPQGSQEQPPQEQQQGKPGIYPANPAEAVRFANNIMEEIFRGGAEGPNIQAVINLPQDIPPEKGIGMIAGKIVGDMLGQLRATGKRPAIKIAFGAVKRTVAELIEVGEHAGVPGVDQSIADPAMAVASGIIDQHQGGGQAQEQSPEGPGPQQQPPQGAAIAMPAIQQGGM